MSSSHSSHKDYDDSPPRNGVIFFYAVLTVFVLIGVKFLLDSYFAKTMDAEVHDKVLTRGMEEVTALKAKEKETLERDGMSAAMRAVAQRGRNAFPQIAPVQGKQAPEVQGWTQLGRKVEVAPMVANETTVTPGV